MRTEELLEQSQKLTQELQSQSEELRRQQDELKKSNVELEQQAKTLRKSEELLKDFYGLFTLTRGRHQLPPIPYTWFRNLVLCQGEALEIRVAHKDKIPISAILTLQFKETVYYKYGCSDVRFNRFGATPWLFWKAMVAAKTRGARAFDFGRTEEDNLGLLAFKNHWAPYPRSLIYWRYPIGSSSLVSVTGWKLKMAKRVFSCLPDRVLKVIGELVYRHIG